jgi:isopentenyl-diphosphate delta-isomerase
VSTPAKDRSNGSAEGEVARRKDAHLDLCLNEDVGAGGPATGLGGFTFEYDALPELDLADVDISTTVLGKRLAAPLFIGAMTGGTERAREINQRLARAAARVGVGMALGSQRAMIVRPELTPTFVVRDVAPALPLLVGNVGAVQLNYGVSASDIVRAVEAVGADAVNFHLNPLQEAIQPEGDTRFAGLHAKLSALIPSLPVPALVKEVGAGIGLRAAHKLAQLPLAGVEVAGTGGTSWAKVESFRAPADSAQAEVGRRLAGFGVPTAASIRICREAFGDRVVIASGGIRTGMDVAVALALGADAAACARPMLEAAAESEEQAVRALETLLLELRVICFCTGARDIAALRCVRLIAPGGSWSRQSPEVTAAKKHP